MGNKDFHDKPYDEGTATKLRIFQLYTEEWLPVFLSQAKPKFEEVHVFDFFCGPGTDSRGDEGSPLKILGQLRLYHEQGMAGWNKVRIAVHLFDEDLEKIQKLRSVLQLPEWRIPGVRIDCRPLAFAKALVEHHLLLSNSRAAKLLIIDQCGVDQVSDDVFRKLIAFPVADFIFFLSSSTLNRFRDHSAIKQKIDKPEDPYHVHRAAIDYFRKLVPTGTEVYLAPFSIKKKKGNIYGLVFGSQHPLGIHKFLKVAWAKDEIAGEANFDIEREDLSPGEGILPLEIMRAKKLLVFEEDLEIALRAGKMKSEADIVRFCIEAGMTCQHSSLVLKKLKAENVIELDFRVPDVGKLKLPRPIRMLH